MDENRLFVDYLIQRGVLRSPSLIDAFLRCDRMLFVPDHLKGGAYGDYPLSIGEGQTISQPTTVAIMLELLAPQEGNRILDIGSGSGWTTALLASAVGDNGYVEGMERIKSLVEFGRENLRKAGIANASIEPSDTAALGKPGRQYDRILVSASAPVMPSELFDQLKPDGSLVIPVHNSLWHFTKNAEGAIDAYELPGFRFVPLIVAL